MQSMLLAKCRRHASLFVEACSCITGDFRAKHDSTIHYAFPGMLPAVHGRLVPGNDARSFFTKVM